MTSSNSPIILPKQGSARVKCAMSGDTVVLLGKPMAAGHPEPEVVFTLESLSAPRYDILGLRRIFPFVLFIFVFEFYQS